MDEQAQINEFMKPKCLVKVGDRIYRAHKNMTVPDRMEVIEIKPSDPGYFIRVKYLYHAIGPFERTYSDMIFHDDSWVIEKKGIDF